MVDRAHFGRLRDVDHSWLHAVLQPFVVEMAAIHLLNQLWRDFSIDAWHGDYFVSCRLDGTGLMHGDVSGFHTYHSLVWTQNGGYDGFVCLCAADEKMHIGIGGIADASDNLACILAVAVFAVSGGLLHVGLCKSLKDACMRSFGVVAFEVDHKSQIRCFRKFSQNLRNI